MKNIEMDIPATPENQKAFEELKKMATEGEMVLYGKVDGEYFPIANLSRHPACPQNVFDNFLSKLVQCEF